MYYLTNDQNQQWCRVENYTNPKDIQNIWLSDEEITHILSYTHMSIKPYHYWTHKQAQNAIQNQKLKNATISKGFGLNG